jgi:acetoin utilization deacetylase AcuC-like enzyme/GNAT superfamily N-acetyltransferase
MIRIRTIINDLTPIDKKEILQVQVILREQFPLVPETDIKKIPEMLRNPLKYRFRAILFVADDLKGNIKGFALLLHAPILRYCFLDFISTSKTMMGGGIGGALYERVREEAIALNVHGIFFECLPDDPELCHVSAEILKNNVSRLRFYERYGAYPIIQTAYETPIKPADLCPPYLVYDDLGRGIRLSRGVARDIVRSILERKYGESCPPGYIDKVVSSFADDPVRLREPRYVRPESIHAAVNTGIPPDRRISLVVSDSHAIHHIHERGYVESPVRIDAILKEIGKTDLFEREQISAFSEEYIRQVHDIQFVDYLKKVCASLDPDESVYPYVFPLRNAARPPLDLPTRAGYFCIDTFTPLNRNAYPAAKRAVDCALTGARKILEGKRLAYALIRPPGHHSERRAFGGFCYFNSAAIAANYLSANGRVALLGIDYHHGNGSQMIFYQRQNVLFLSIHGHPSFAYPYFSGFEDEKGEGWGAGYNLNFPLPETITPELYIETVEKALRHITRFSPIFIVVSLGLDTAKGDPTGSWPLRARDFEAIGRMIGSVRLPTLVVQEGGYNTRNLGLNARHFFYGLHRAYFQTEK